MKKLLFSAYDMNVGGIETSLLTLLNTLIDKNYDITLVLEKKQGVFLSELDSRIHIIEYTPCNISLGLVRKFINLVKRINFIIKYKNKFDFSASYATYSKMASFTARTASSNNALWVHSDYMQVYHKDIEKIQNFFDNLKCGEFKNIILVSKASYNSFYRVYPELEDKLVLVGNLINYQKIQALANKNIDIKKENYTFLTVGRHDEKEKKLTRVVDVAEKLKNEGFSFSVWFVGEGKDTELYKNLIKEKGLQDYIKLLGIQKNPYPYFKKADAVLLTSDYEGYPVVFQEAFVLGKPIITTDVSDAKMDIENKFGSVTSKDTESIYEAMKQFIKEGYTIKEKFNAEEYNKNIIKEIEKIIN